MTFKPHADFKVLQRPFPTIRELQQEKWQATGGRGPDLRAGDGV